MAEFPTVTLVLEGHADERGSREYNLALGERRAKAIERILSVEGVPAEQLQVISFGEERPVALSHDEEAWRLNRRVELLYSGY
jgi:peptidoglycan-associated lipoprotein